MGRIIFITAILVLTCGALGASYTVCSDLHRNDVKKERIERNTRANVLESAKRWIGVRELTGNNDHPMITKSMKLCGLRGDKKYPWCASSHSEIFDNAMLSTVISARVVDWFKSNVIWERKWSTPIPDRYIRPGMSVGFFYERLNRYGHIGLLVHKSSKYAYTYEGNTSSKGQFDPETFENVEEVGTGVNRDGDGFYPKVRPWYMIDVISDKCLQGKDFDRRYYDYLSNIL
jgi:hypothetical protein